MIGVQVNDARPGLWGVMVVCDECRDLVAESGLMLWDAAAPDPPEVVKGHLEVCSEACAVALRTRHPQVTTWGSKSIARVASELAIATRTVDEVGRDMMRITRRRWDRTYRVEARSPRGGGKTR